MHCGSVTLGAGRNTEGDGMLDRMDLFESRLAELADENARLKAESAELRSKVSRLERAAPPRSPSGDQTVETGPDDRTFGRRALLGKLGVAAAGGAGLALAGGILGAQGAAAATTTFVVLGGTNTVNNSGTSPTELESTATTGTLNSFQNATAGSAGFETALYGQSTNPDPTIWGNNMGSGAGVRGSTGSPVAPSAAVGVLGSSGIGPGTGVQGVTASSSPGQSGVAGIDNSTAPGGGYGIYGKSTLGIGAYGVSNSAGGIGVYGYSASTSTAPGTGVYGTTNSPNGYGVQGSITSTTSYAIGVYGSTQGSGNAVAGAVLNGFNNDSGVFGSTVGFGFGVFGSGGSSGTGVSGQSAGPGAGVSGYSSSSGVGVQASGGRAQLYLQPAGTTGSPTTGAHDQGELFEDANGILWLCTVAGTLGTWRPLNGATGFASGSVDLMASPFRLYDSRSGQSDAPLGGSGPIAPGPNSARNIQVTGTAPQTSTAVPAGAVALIGNLTVVNTTGSGGGYLQVYPQGDQIPSVSDINWYAAGQIVANRLIVALGAGGGITVVNGGVGGSSATDFIVDVTGFVL